MTPITPASLPRVAPARPAVLSAPAAPQVRARAQGGDPLPSFQTPTDYQNYVINLVGQSRNTQRELESARKALNGPSNAGARAMVETLHERQDALKLQLLLLRDNYAIPAEWTRWKVLGGYGFDKDAFWKAQVEAIPGQEVHVTPEAVRPAPPTPAPARPAPAPPTPAALPAAPVAAGGPLAEPLRRLIATYAADGLTGNANSAGEAFKRDKLQAMLPILRGSDAPEARQAVALISETLDKFAGNYLATHEAYYVALVGVQQLVTTAGDLGAKHERLIERFAAEGVQANTNSAGQVYGSARLAGVERHARLAGDPYSREITRIVSAVRAEYAGNYLATHEAYKLGLRSATFLHDARSGATPAARARSAAKAFAAEGQQANVNAAGETYARERLKAIVRLAQGSADEGLQAVHALVADCLAKNAGNYQSTHMAYRSTLQAVEALLA